VSESAWYEPYCVFFLQPIGVLYAKFGSEELSSWSAYESFWDAISAWLQVLLTMGDSELNAPLLPEIFGVSEGGNPSGKGDASPTQNGRAATSEAVRDGSSADHYKNLLSNKSKEGWKFQPHMLLSRRGFHDAKHHSEGKSIPQKYQIHPLSSKTLNYVFYWNK
jgi:hypothetical protein